MSILSFFNKKRSEHQSKDYYLRIKAKLVFCIDEKHYQSRKLPTSIEVIQVTDSPTQKYP